MIYSLYSKRYKGPFIWEDGYIKNCAVSAHLCIKNTGRIQETNETGRLQGVSRNRVERKREWEQ